jgi:archaellin
LVYLGQPVTLANSSRISVKANDIIEIWYATSGVAPSTSATFTITPNQGALEAIPFKTPTSYIGEYVALFP